MRAVHPRLRAPGTGAARALAALLCGAVPVCLALAPGAVGDTTTYSPRAVPASGAVAGGQGAQGGQGTPASAKATLATATLQQCATATQPQTERSAAFAGEMTATAQTARMQMRIVLEERAAQQPRYRTVAAPALGAWHTSNPGVKVFTHIQQVTNLSAPAQYRALVSFRWLDAQGRVIKSEQLLTADCEQPAAR